MPIFATGKLIPVEIKYVDLKLKDGAEITIVVDSDDMEKRFGDKVKVLKTQWAVPNWKDNHDAIRLSTVTDPMTGNKGVDIHQYKSVCLEKFLKAWDITDEAGKPVPVTKDKIMSLDFTIARALVDQFINRHIPSEEELGN
jgi:hypothetical protein